MMNIQNRSLLVKSIVKSVTVLIMAMLLPLATVTNHDDGFEARLISVEENKHRTMMEKRKKQERRAKALKLDKILTILKKYKTGLKKEIQAELVELIYQESLAYNYEPELILALVAKESSFYNWSKSRKGALGLMQILPTTGAAIAQAINIPWDGKQTLFDPHTNIKLGTHYLSKLHKRFGQLEVALTAYNYGPARVSRMQTQGVQLPKKYATRILNTYEQFMRINTTETGSSDENGADAPKSPFRI
ncbi:MAG: lytic transglycosylase domain-containing protein [Nitrospiria bacterium]